MTEPLILPFTLADHGEALALWQATPGVGLSEADGREAIGRFLQRNPGTSFVARADGRLVATLLCGHDGRRGLLHHLVVHPASRRRGLGAQLVRHALQALAGQGIGKCHLMVFRDNAEGRAFWAGIGADERVTLSLYSLGTEGPANGLTDGPTLEPGAQPVPRAGGAP